MFNTLYLLTTLNISIQTIDCNNLQNSYVLVLCFWGEGDCWVRGGWGLRNISSPLRGGIKYFPTLLGGVPNFMVEFWNTLHPPPSTHTLWPVPYMKYMFYSEIVSMHCVLLLSDKELITRYSTHCFLLTMDHLHYRLNFDLDKNFITAWKSITKLVTFQNFVAKCCKMRII
jgi:hypothetical protein